MLNIPVVLAVFTLPLAIHIKNALAFHRNLPVRSPGGLYGRHTHLQYNHKVSNSRHWWVVKISLCIIPVCSELAQKKHGLKNERMRASCLLFAQKQAWFCSRITVLSFSLLHWQQKKHLCQTYLHCSPELIVLCKWCYSLNIHIFPLWETGKVCGSICPKVEEEKWNGVVGSM